MVENERGVVENEREEEDRKRDGDCEEGRVGRREREVEWAIERRRERKRKV